MVNNKETLTIADIAHKAHVSPSTVSRVLRGSAGVVDAKREAVMQAVRELNYRPNIFAQSLASGQSMTIGVLTQNFGSPFYDGILQGILQGLEDTDYWPIFADGRWQTDLEQRALENLRDRQVDGLILIGGELPETTLQAIAASLPLIIVARDLATLPDQCISLDNEKGGYQATRYLLEMGHRDIAHITVPATYHRIVNDVHERRMGYKQALHEAGIEPDPRLLVEGNLLQQSGVLGVETLLGRGRPFSAIFAANDQMAFGARLALYRRGIRVPDDVSLIGFDDETSAAYMVPPLTTMRQPANAMGCAAAKVILDMINDKSVGAMKFAAELIVRESVRRYR